MTLTLDLPPDVQQALDEAAAGRQQSVAEIAALWLAEAARARREAQQGANVAPPKGDIEARVAALEARLAEFKAQQAATSNGAALPTAQAPAQPIVLSSDRATRSAQLAALLYAPADVREATLAAGASALADDYANDPEVTELTRALQGEDFYGFEDEDEADEGAATAQRVAP